MRLNDSSDQTRNEVKTYFDHPQRHSSIVLQLWSALSLELSLFRYCAFFQSLSAYSKLRLHTKSAGGNEVATVRENPEQNALTKRYNNVGRKGLTLS